MRVSQKDQQGDSGVFAVASKFNDDLGWVFREQPKRDLGIDAIVEVIDDGISHGQLLALQIKSGNSYFREESPSEIVYRFDNEHYEYWTQYDLPVLVVLHKPEISTVYWQVVNKDTAQGTGKNWKNIIPKSNTLSKKNSTNIKAYCDYIVPTSSYSIMSFKDESHGAAKRYSARILLNVNLSKGEIIQVIQRITGEMRGRQYYRSELTQTAWHGKRADVVWLFVFPSFEDEKNNNWICRSQWIDPKLNNEFRPFSFSGMEIGSELVIDWSEMYYAIAKLHNETGLTKEVYLSLVEEMLEKVYPYVKKAITLTAQNESGEIASSDYLKLMTDMQPDIRALYFESMDIGGSPVECNDFNTKINSLIAILDNLFLPFSEEGLGNWNEQARNKLVADAIEDFKNTMAEMEYEKSKLH